MQVTVYRVRNMADDLQGNLQNYKLQLQQVRLFRSDMCYVYIKGEVNRDHVSRSDVWVAREKCGRK